MKRLAYRFMAIASCLVVVVSSFLPGALQGASATQSYGHYQYAEGSASSVAGQYYGRSEYLNGDAAAAFQRMQSDAAAQGVNLGIVSGYRSIGDQQTLFERQISRQGSAKAAARLSAPPGHSEHHTGYALDIRDADNPSTDLQTSFEGTPTYRWMQANAGKYGFEMSFPAGNAQGVSYEPWHWRYVGTPAAQSVFAQSGARSPPASSATPVATPSPTSVTTAIAPTAPAAAVGQACPIGANLAPNIPNINQANFGSMTLPNAGTVSASGPFTRQLLQQGSPTSYSWGQGQAIASTLSLGDIQSLQPQQLTLNQIGQQTNTNIKDTALSTFQLIGLQTVGSLADAVPGLPQMPLAALQPIADLVNRGGRAYLKAFLMKQADAPLAQLLKVDPAFGKVPLNQMALQQFAISSIPGLADTALGNFQNWQTAQIAGIPGLSQLPLSAFPGGGCLLNSPVPPIGIIDNVFGPNEAMANYHAITGSDVEEFRVPCNQQNCAYAELRDPAGANGPLHQARWIKGGKPEQGGQMVKGGHGVLGQAFGGQEPTGRMPFGPQSNLKLVLTDTNESSGRADFSLYLRVCKKELGCTPFIFGPIPFMSAREGSPVLVGLDNQATFSEPSVELPDDVRRQIDQVNEQYPDSGSGDMGGNCAKAAISATEGGFLTAAQQNIPLILSEAQKAGLTPNQTAYVLATARLESGMGKYMELLGDHSAWGTYYARGFVGLTHQENYAKFSQILGVNLLENPNLASDPKIAAQILVQGMKQGSFTGYKLDDFINGNQTNFYDARAIINGVKDHADMVAGYADQYQKSLKSCVSAGSSCTGGGGMVKPSQGPVVSEFGMRLHPIYGTWRLHAGADIGSPYGASVVSADCGKVVETGWQDGYGNVVIVQHNNGLTTRYAHLSAIQANTGQTVNRGQTVGQVGASGNVTGPHLHFETRTGGEWGEAHNPRSYVAL